MIFLILPLISFSLNEAYFENQENLENQCICAVKSNECSPYCYCDPHCTSEQKEEFNFYLSESYSLYKIACDPHDRIDKINLNSIEKHLINGNNCYLIKGKEYGKKISNLNSLDFGLANFSHLTYSTFTQNVNNYFEVDSNVSYKDKEKIIGSFSTSKPHYFYLPIAIGSSCSNALIPIRFNVSYPNYTCRFSSPSNLTQRHYFPQNLVIEYIADRIEDPNNQVYFHGFLDTLLEINNPHTFLNLQYIFEVNLTNSSIINVTLKVIPSTSSFQPSSNFAGISSQVFFGENINQLDNTYTPLSMGYYYGCPLMADSSNDPDLTSFDVSNRQPIQIDSNDVLFGINSTIIKIFRSENNANSNTYDISYIRKELPNMPDIQINQIINNMFPRYKYIHKSYGSVIAGRDTSLFVENPELFGPNNTHISNDHTFPIAYWTFYYKKFNNESNPIFMIQKFIPSLVLPSNTNLEHTKGMIKVVFIELDDNGKISSDEEVRFHSGKFSTLFDFFFMDESDALNTIGIFFCFAIIATIWSWYSCFFYIED